MAQNTVHLPFPRLKNVVTHLPPFSVTATPSREYSLLSLITQPWTIILGTFDTFEVGTPSPVQCCTNRWYFCQKNVHFLVFSTLQRGKGGEVGKVSQDYWPTM